MESFIQFIKKSPTVYHAAREITAQLDAAEFTPLLEGEKWNLESGKGYYVQRDNTLVAAFRLPKKKAKSSTLLATHTDSPALKIKPKGNSSCKEIGQIGTEIYGGPLLYTWFDRDLAIAGRILVQDKNGNLQTKFVYLDDQPLIIPSVAIHLNREVNEKGFSLNKQDHLKAIFSLSVKEKQLEEAIATHHQFDTLVNYDLFLVPTEKSSFIGFNNELIASYRLDNLSSAYASLNALLQTSAQDETIQMAIFWDHEEIGSKTYAGADSPFINQVLERICLQFKMDKEDYYCLKNKSVCLSCDVSHGFHPNYSEKYDPQNASFLGKGPAIKFSSRYATTGSTAAAITALANKHKIPLQTYASRSDMPCGSTVGAMMGATLGIPTVDLGIPCWAMHSARETISTHDQLMLHKLLKVALEEPLTVCQEAL